jgi:hypothetical protein
MNRLAFTLVMLLFTTGLSLAKPGTSKRINKRPSTAPAQLSQQVASYISYPQVLREGQREGIVVITFSVSENNRLSRLKVHTFDRDLNDDITRQLVGKKIRLADNNPFETYAVRLRFVR